MLFQALTADTIYKAIATMSLPILRSLASLAAPPGRLAILIFHRVLAERDALLPGEPDAVEFDRQMALLARTFRVLPLTEAVAALAEGRLPNRALSITFDDGYRDNHDVALPILHRHGLSATFFVASGYLDGGRMFNDSIIETVRALPAGEQMVGEFGPFTLDAPASRISTYEAIIRELKHRPPAERAERTAALVASCGVVLPTDLMMERAQVRALAEAGMEIGGHTASHSILQQLSEREAEQEIAAGRDQLEAIIGRPITLFSYPNGKPQQDYGAPHPQLVRRLGFSAAVSTAWGVADRRSDPFQLPRFTPWDRDPLRFALRLLHNYWRAPTEVV